MASPISTLLSEVAPQEHPFQSHALASMARPRPTRRILPAQRKPPQPAVSTTSLPNDISSRFGRRLRELRHSRSLTQADMARKFGIDRSFISEIECGRKAISLPMLEVIALGLQVSLSELLHDL